MAADVVTQVVPTGGLFSNGVPWVIWMAGGVIAVRFAFAALVVVKRAIASVGRDADEDDLYEQTVETIEYYPDVFVDDWSSGERLTEDLVDDLVAHAFDEVAAEEAMSVARELEAAELVEEEDTGYGVLDSYYDEVGPGVFDLMGGDRESGDDLAAQLDHAAYFADLELEETTDEELEDAGDAQAA